MRLLGESLGVPIRVFGPDTHITEIVPLALGVEIKKGEEVDIKSIQVETPLTRVTRVEEPPENANVGAIHPGGERTQASDQIVHFQTSAGTSRPSYRPFDENTRSFVYGLQPRAIQGMLDFDYSCGRSAPLMLMSSSTLPVAVASTAVR